MDIHDKLKIARTFKGWSQEEMAEKLGYSISGYGKLERGETKLDLQKLEKIAEILGVNWQDLLTLDEKNVFHFAENCTHANNIRCNITLGETHIIHELEKAKLIIEQQAKEIAYLKEIIEMMKK